MMMMVMVIIVHHMVSLIIWFIYIWFMWQIITDINGLMQSHGLMVNFTGLRIQVLVAKVCDVLLYPYLTSQPVIFRSKTWKRNLRTYQLQSS